MPEVVQELFVYLWKNREKTKKIDFVQSYVYAALRFNSIRKFNSKTRDRMEIAEVPEEEYSVDFHDQIEYAELQQAVFKAIDSLPPQCRKIFMMSRFERLTYQKIANILGISPKTVEVQISKALRIVHETLRKYHSGIIFFWICNHHYSMINFKLFPRPASIIFLNVDISTSVLLFSILDM